MRKFKIGTLGLFLAALFLAGTFTVSCSLLASSDAAITKDIKAKISSDPLLKNGMNPYSETKKLGTLADFSSRLRGVAHPCRPVHI
jgi:hypothetical protein